MRTDFVLDALEQAIHARGHDALTGLVHHSDQGVQYLSMRYTDRLADAGIAPSVGSRGDAYDNALAESVIGLFKTEVIQRKGPWRSLEAVEFATLVWVDWFNHRRAARADRRHPAGGVRSAVLCPGQGGLIQRIRSPTFPVRFTYIRRPELRAKGPPTGQPKATPWVTEVENLKSPNGAIDITAMPNHSPASTCMSCSAQRTACPFSATQWCGRGCMLTWRACCNTSAASPSSSTGWRTMFTSCATSREP